jgi:hypothetical protein
VLKLIFWLFLVDVGPGYPKMAGCKFSHPSTPFGGHFGLQTPPKSDPLHIFGNNDGIFMILRSFWGFLIPGYPKMAGCKFSDPPTPFGGNFGLQTAPKLTRYISLVIMMGFS